MAALLPYIGFALLIAGLLIVLAALIRFLADTFAAFKRPGAPLGGGAVDPADWAKLAEAVAKLPAWAIAMIAADVQIWLGLRMLGVNIFA